MKIESSSIAMASSHSYQSYAHTASMTINAPASQDVPGAILTLSKESQGQSSYLEEMKLYQQEKEDAAGKQSKENQQKSLQNLMENLNPKTDKTDGGIRVSSKYEMQLELLRRLLEMMKAGRRITASDVKGSVLDLRSAGYKREAAFSLSGSSSVTLASGGGAVGTTGSGTLWQRVTATSGFETEYETTAFATTGKVQTADGRSIDFHVEFGMSRACMSKIDTLSSEKYIMTDPLIINLDSNITSVTDQKFFFDLDSDGKEEEISFAGAGSGFLALDKNGDGKINDGSELFGTASGDGFKDLAAYDQDGNGWIDENDEIFSKLKVWTKDENGNDRLIDLKEADVGAIYLGNADTEYSFKNDENQMNGALRKTGIYLKESSGAAGTISHVDLAV